MDEENKNIVDDQDYPENFEDTFEIGIPIEDTLSTLEKSESPENTRDTKTDIETDAEPNDEPDTEAKQESEESVESAENEIPEEEIPEEEIPEEEIPEAFHYAEIKDQLKELSQSFETKIKYDEHKNKIIDDLHQSLQEFREGLIKKYLHRFITDIIKIVDDMRKFASHHKGQPHSEETTEKLLKYIDNISSDLEDLFSWEGVEPFTCDGDMIDTSRQRILNKIETDDPEKDKTVAERLRPGYEWDGKVIRPEMVSAYIYQKESTAEDNNNS